MRPLGRTTERGTTDPRRAVAVRTSSIAGAAGPDRPPGATSQGKTKMNRRKKFVLAALCAALLLSIGAGTASALRSLRLDGERTLQLTGRFTAIIGAITIRCNVTIRKTYTPIFPKRAGTVIGNIIEYALPRPETCELAGARRLNIINTIGVGVAERWRIVYKTFLGTLPEITGILFEWQRIEKEFEIEETFANLFCIYNNEGVAGSLGLLARVNRGIIERLRTLETPAEVTEKQLQAFSSARCPMRMRLKYELTPAGELRLTLL
jgi:hypothetical protein